MYTLLLRMCNRYFPLSSSMLQISDVLERGGLTVIAVSDDALRYEMLDSNTGHSIATRIIDDNNSFTFNTHQIQVRGKTALNDNFIIERTQSGAGDARNFDSLIAQQSADMDGVGSGGFSAIFSTIVASVGASVRSNQQALDGAEAPDGAEVPACRAARVFRPK